MTLTDFLLARIAEDEEAVTPSEGWSTTPASDDVPVQFWDYGEIHIGHKRFLAECEAKRRIVGFLTTHPRQHWLDLAMKREVLANLALPYADHPDYREEWKP